MIVDTFTEEFLYNYFGREEKDYEISDKKLTQLKP